MNPFVTTEWLARRVEDANTVVLDGTWRMPGSPPARADFEKRRIPHARFFDIDAIADETSSLPHMLPSEERFERGLEELGIGAASDVIVYEEAGLFAAPRVWWTFRTFGFDNVKILEGGFAKWKQDGLPVETGRPQPPPPGGKQFKATLHRELVADPATIRSLLTDETAIVLDVRPAERFHGVASEPRPGLRCGHMPGSMNLPVGRLLDEQGSLLDEDDLKSCLKEFLPASTIAISCGSGVAAALGALAFARIGRDDVLVYDGSWTEWGRVSNKLVDFPVATTIEND